MYIVNSINTRPKFSSVLEVNDPSMPCENRNFPMNRFFYKPVDDRVQHRKGFPQGTILGSEKFAFSKVSHMQTNNIFSVRSVARMYFSFQISEHLLGIQLELSRKDSGMRHLGLW